MELFETILTRSSKRDFEDKPVPKETIDKILSASLRAPSWANSQPWEIAVSTGKTSEFIKKSVYKLASEDNPGNPDFPMPVSPVSWPEKQAANMFEAGKLIYESFDISRDETAKRKDIVLYNLDFFGSQTAIFIYIDEKLGHYSILDCGMIIQNILLCAHDLGLGACPQAYLVGWPDILREAFNLSESKKFLLGISIGFYKKDNVINTIQTSRVELKDAVKYYD
ncbi:MAG: nitroreductase [bacterium]